MNGFYGEIGLELVNDRIREMHADVASERRAAQATRRARPAARARSIGWMFGRSLRALGLSH